MQVLLDTNFIISCLMKRIDFMNELEVLGFNILVPREVMQELKDLRTSDKTSSQEREMIEIALNLLNSKKIKKTKLGHRSVDQGLVQKGLTGTYIATLDRVIKNKVPNKVVISSAKNSLTIMRD